MLFDTQSDQVRLTQVELNRIRKHAARQGHTVDSITTADELDEALLRACTVQEISQLLKAIQKQVDIQSRQK